MQQATIDSKSIPKKNMRFYSGSKTPYVHFHSSIWSSTTNIEKSG